MNVNQRSTNGIPKKSNGSPKKPSFGTVGTAYHKHYLEVNNSFNMTRYSQDQSKAGSPSKGPVLPQHGLEKNEKDNPDGSVDSVASESSFSSSPPKPNRFEKGGFRFPNSPANSQANSPAKSNFLDSLGEVRTDTVKALWKYQSTVDKSGHPVDK
jgi:hypothetical protein